MLRRHSFVYLVSVSILLVVLACATIPAIPAQPAAQPLSTTDPDAFATLVADSAAAFLTQTAEAQPASPSLTPSLPSLTNTPAPTPTATPVASREGTALSQQEDGSTLFTDTLAGVRLTIPAGWVTVRLNEPEYYQVWSLTVDDPVLQHGLEGIQNLDPARFRLHAFNTQPDYVYEGEGSQINVVYVREDVRTLEQIAEDEKQPQAFTDYALLSSEFQVRPDGLELFIIEEQWRGTSATEASVMIHYKGVIFKVTSGTVAVDLFVPAEISHEVVPVFDRMIEQMAIIIP
jgi:hypothetical protein